jgi:hypothetical protein
MFLTLLHTKFLNAMVWDNRYFPWFDHLYTGADSRKSNIDAQIFFLQGGDAFRYQSRSDRDEQIISLTELYGQLDLVPVANALVRVGKPNPLPDDWQWISEIKALMPTSMEGQGGILSMYGAIAPHFGIGGSMLMMKLNNFVNVLPSPDAINQLNLNTPGNMAVFDQTLQKIYKEINITSTCFQEIGIGDIVIYANFYDVHEYKYKFRKIDWGLWLGFIIPSGLKYNPTNLGSIGFGNQYGGWGWFAAPRAEFELRDDLKFGIMGRITQRFDTCFKGRIPFGKEQSLFAPVIGSIGVDQGTTFGVTTYFVFEDVRAGLGVQIQYTINHHENDTFYAKVPELEVSPKFMNSGYYSSWTDEYFSIKLFYDIAYDKFWKTRPNVYFLWDCPMNHLFGKGFARTNKIALGCTVNF